MRTSRRCAKPAQSQSRVARHGVHLALRYLENGAGAVIGTDPDLAAPGVQALLAHPVLLALLRATPAATPRLEIFLARARFGLCAYPTRARAADSEVPSVALLGCYESLQDLPESVWAAPALAPIHAAHVAAPKRAASIAASLTPITPIDASSAPVAAQYEADPYPMWVREPVGLAVALPPAVARRADPKRVRQHRRVSRSGVPRPRGQL